MALRGPQPTPTRILEARGSWRAAARHGEPDPAVGEPDCPEWVSEDARPYWHRIASDLLAISVLTKVDGIGLGQLSDSLAAYVRAKDILDEEGEILTKLTGHGTEVKSQHPAVQLKYMAADRLLRLLREFGLTPASRASLHVEPQRPPKEQPTEQRNRFVAQNTA